MDFGTGVKNGVLLLALIVAIHVIITKPEALHNLLMHSGSQNFAEKMTSPQFVEHTNDSDENDLLKFVYSDEDRGALDRFFKGQVSDSRFASNANVVENAHLQTGRHGIQDAAYLKPMYEPGCDSVNGMYTRNVPGMDTFAADFACPV
jgi:hypothetical protein